MSTSSTASRLDELIGLGSAKRVLREIIPGNSGVHAVLLYGSAGSGKNVLASLLAQAWMCQSPTPDGADGTCRACGAFERDKNVDFLHITPQGPSQIIAVKAITNDSPKDDDPVPVLSFFRTMPLMSRHKVALIEAADAMNVSANNALLKTLEEPYPHAKLILTTDSIGKILPTILSRCVAVACEAPSLLELRDAFPEATADEIRMADGTPGRLRHLLTHRAAYEGITRLARTMLRRRRGEALVAAEDLRQVAEGLEAALKCGMRAANAETLEMLALFFSREPGAPPEWTHDIAEAHRRVMRNGQASLIFDALATKMLGQR